MSNKTSDKDVANIEDDIELVKRYLENSAYKESNSDFFKNGGWEMVDLEIPKAMANILAEREQDKQRIKELEEYILISPNLDEMTATKYINIQKEAYIRGRAEEQQRAEQIIYEHYIPKQVVIDKVNEINKKYEDSKDENGESPYFYPDFTIRILQKLLEGEK